MSLYSTPIFQLPRAGWEAQMQAAQAVGQEPEGELLEGFSDAFEDTEWQW
jgi:antitoxin MazE